MEHPWIDFERNVLCAATLLAWAMMLLVWSPMLLGVKLLCMTALVGLVVYHAQRKHLSYEVTFACLLASGILFLSDPMFLPQTVLLVYVLLIIASLCLFLSIETLFLFIVFALAITYSAFLTFAIAAKSDPAFTSLFLLALTSFWLVFLRPSGRNEV